MTRSRPTQEKNLNTSPGSAPKRPPRLTPKQQSFVQEYLVDLNATQAAMRAGYSQRTAQRIGSENLSKPLVAEAIAQALAERAKRTEVKADRVVLELARIGYARITDVVDSGPGGLTLRRPSDVPDDAAAAVAELRETRGRSGLNLRVRMHDKLRALELLGKHLGIFSGQVEQENNRDFGTIYYLNRSRTPDRKDDAPGRTGSSEAE